MLECQPENARKYLDWIQNRGGIAHWKSVDLGDLGKSWCTPNLDMETLKPTPKPHWKCGSTPHAIITDPKEVMVVEYEEKKRFHIALRRSGSGMSIKLTDASSRKVNKQVEKAGENAVYEFDYYTQDCVILVPKSSVPLPYFLEENISESL